MNKDNDEMRASTPETQSSSAHLDQERARPRTADEIASLIRGAIQTGQLGDAGRLPTVRQTAREFGVAQATAAKAYRALERDGLLVTRTAAGTHVAPSASRASDSVIEGARSLAAAAQSDGIQLEDCVALLRVLWPHRE